MNLGINQFLSAFQRKMVKEKKLPFRVAHQIVGRTVSKAIEDGIKPSDINSDYINLVAFELTGEYLKLDEELVKRALDPEKVVSSRKVIGGPAPEIVKKAISQLRKYVEGES